MTWLPNSQELAFAAGSAIIIMHSKSCCMLNTSFAKKFCLF